MSGYSPSLCSFSIHPSVDRAISLEADGADLADRRHSSKQRRVCPSTMQVAGLHVSLAKKSVRNGPSVFAPAACRRDTRRIGYSESERQCDPRGGEHLYYFTA